VEAFDNKEWLTVKYYIPYILLILWLPIIGYVFVKLTKNSSFRKKYLKYCILAVIMICGIWLRWFLLTTTFQFPDSDEATIGVMSLKILRGESFLMYYGSAYAGSFDSLVSSLCFLVLGINNLALKFYPLMVSLIVVYLTYLLGSEIYNVRVGLLASLFASIGTPFMIDWSVDEFEEV
jgi:predicted membrane-bound mannosyltransferase